MWKSITHILLSLPPLSHGHGSMITPPPRQPESPYWYQVGCFIGCQCSGSGKEMYPQHESLGCPHPIEPTLPHSDDDDDDDVVGSWNIASKSPRGDWNKFLPWRSPGSSIPIDSCGIASGFLPDAAVQYPHIFSSFRNDTDGGGTTTIRQGDKGTHLPPGPISIWKANDVVTASFSLIVNHGGGYQYRVCPKTTPPSSDATTTAAAYPTESCFSDNPLPFTTNYHTVVHGTKTFTIPATDVTMGVTPEGSTWRRIPLPACNCDSGYGCIAEDTTTTATTTTTADDFRRSYEGGAGGYGSCETGLQFAADHLTDGTWPGGYGYYVTRLFDDDDDDYEMTSKSSSPCMIHKNDTSCRADETHDCLWYAEKNVCYETRWDDNDDKKDGDGLLETEKTKTKVIFDDCPSHVDESSCIVAKTTRGYPCTWYEDANKKACYDKESFEETYINQKETNKKTTMSDEYVASVDWRIVDHLRAPSIPGEYILQWRWDNEQTPQIWTTCADILVVEGGDDEEEKKSGGLAMLRGGSLVMWGLWWVAGWMGLYSLVGGVV